MKYMCLMYNPEATAQEFTQEQVQEVAKEWMQLMQEAQAAGVLVSNNGLAPTANATTVRVRDGKTLTTDGPFAETHEQLAGFFLLDCKDLDEALSWAAKIPTARYGSVEVRPLWNNA